MAALDLAALYERSGNIEQSELLLDAVEGELPFWPRRGVFGIGFADAELQATRGNNAAALAALRRAAEDGLTHTWWWILDDSPHFTRLREHRQFADIRADFAALGAIRE